MVRIAVFNGIKKKRGLSLLEFTALNELEYTKVPLGSFSLVGRYNDFKERLVANRIYLINIKDEPSKPVKKFEILEKCKLLKYVNGEYLITYKRYRNINLIDLYENRPDDAKDFLGWVFTRGQKSEKVRVNTFTKTILEKLFENYGYENIVQYDKNEKKDWNKEVAERVKSFNKKLDDKSTNWSKDEEDLLRREMAKKPEDRMPEKELASKLGRTVPSIATKKWKLAHEYKSKLKTMKDTAESIAKKLKDFREEHNWSQRQLVEESNISLSVINQLECKNYASTTSPTVIKLLEFIDNYGAQEVEDASKRDGKDIETTNNNPGNKGKEKSNPISPEFAKVMMDKMDQFTRQMDRLNTNLEAMVRVQQDQMKKDKLFQELKEFSKHLEEI